MTLPSTSDGTRTLTPIELERMLAAPARGPVLVLATRRVRGGLDLPGLAAMTWSSWLARSGEPAIELVGCEPVGLAGSAELANEHEVRWLAAGDLHERLLRHLGSATSRISAGIALFLDPWAAQLDEAIVASRPDMARVLVSDLGQRAVGDEKEYWEQLSAWLQMRDGLRLVSAHELVGAMPADAWSALTADDAHINLKRDADYGARLVVMEEGPAAAPSPQSLKAILGQTGDRSGVIFISPHLDWYREREPRLVDACRAAWHPRDLSASTYAALLRQADEYVAAHRLPYGPGPLACLPASCICTVSRADEQSLAGLPVTVRVHDAAVEGAAGRPHDTAQREGLQTRGPARVDDHRAHAPFTSHPHGNTLGETRTADMRAPSVGDGTHQWWKGLTTLIPERGPEPARIAGNPPASGRCDFAFLVCCYKYLQRFRIFVDSIARQTHPLERIELCVATAGNPDGLYEYLNLVRMVHPALVIRLVEVPEPIGNNKGKMLNAAFRASTAAVVMSTDCDIIFSRTFVADMLARHQRDLVIGCWRTPLTKDLTAQILVGNLDPVEHFDALSQQWSKEEETGGVRQGMLGYCQVVSREAFAAVMYPEEFEGFNQSDIVFIDRLREQAGIQSQFMKDYFVLHLSHSRDWTGTKVFL